MSSCSGINVQTGGVAVWWCGGVVVWRRVVVLMYRLVVWCGGVVVWRWCDGVCWSRVVAAWCDEGGVG